MKMFLVFRIMYVKVCTLLWRQHIAYLLSLDIFIGLKKIKKFKRAEINGTTWKQRLRRRKWSREHSDRNRIGPTLYKDDWVRVGEGEMCSDGACYICSQKGGGIEDDSGTLYRHWPNVVLGNRVHGSFIL